MMQKGYVEGSGPPGIAACDGRGQINGATALRLRAAGEGTEQSTAVIRLVFDPSFVMQRLQLFS
jgi:hypothetical protein